jgi:RasGEF domain
MAGVLIVYLIPCQECRKSYNFSSMSAIVAALQSIPQLILTREMKLTKSERQLLPEMDKILDPQADHRAYREVLRNINSPFAIPWLGAHCNVPFPSVKPNIVGLGRPCRYSGPSAHPSNLVPPW